MLCAGYDSNGHDPRSGPKPAIGAFGRAAMVATAHVTDITPRLPIDLRRPDQRSRAERGPVGDLEQKAGRVIARRTGQRVYLQDDGSSEGMVDIRIEYPDKDPGYVEVTADIEGGYAAMWSGLMKSGQIPEVLPMASLHLDWSVTLSGAAKRNALIAELEDLLFSLETVGLTFEVVAPLDTLKATRDASVNRLLSLGVVELASGPAESGRGRARLYPMGIIGPSERSWQSFLEWVSDTLASPKLADVRKKLMKTGSAERHVFLGITFTSLPEVYFGLTIGENGLPSAAPRLPAEITHVWLWNIEGGDRCITWFPDQGWADVMKHWATD